MLKIRALNKESSSDEDVPVIRREAQEEIALELYNKALRLQAEEKHDEAKVLLQQILQENIPLLEDNGGLPKSMQTIKFSCHINIGNIDLKLKKVSQALETFLLASELDGNDVSLWYKIGKLSLEDNKFRQAAYAFTKGLECSESHWPCLDQLISILFAIKDTIACLVYIGKALTMDQDYVKGLALRKQIYLDNPAAKEYYQLYNPDYIWEPPLDLSFDEDEGKSFVEEAQDLTDRVTQVEKSFGSKSLETIPLPKPLEDYTWLSFSKTVIFLHKYLAEKEMSHFTFIDMANAMINVDVEPEKEVLDVISEPEKINSEEISVAKTSECENEEKMDTGSIQERRISQNSEQNNEQRDSTPMQTDNEEDHPMDQETEEQDENIETKSDKGRPKGIKRKRNVLSDLQIWGWHSKRKQSKKAKKRDFTVEDALNRIIPKTLLPNKIESQEKIDFIEDSMNTMDLYNLYIQESNLNYLSPIHSPASVNCEAYFGTSHEKKHVLEVCTKERSYCDVIVLIKELVFSLSKLWNYKWPEQLKSLYVEAYNMFREHCDPPQVFCGGHQFEEMRNDALASILYCELISFNSEFTETVPPTLLGYLQLISGWHEDWKDDYPGFFIRVFWLRAHLFRKENSNDLAVRALELLEEVIIEKETETSERYVLHLPNCTKNCLITKQIIENILKHLDLMNSLGCVENLYNAEKYNEVAAIIKSTFLTHARHHPQVGRLGRPAQLGMLLHSLWFTDLTACFIWTEECLYESYDHFMKPSKESDKWEKILEKCLAILHEIIKKETLNVIDALSEEKRTRLVETLSKIVSKQINCDYVRIPLDCVTPWLLLHYILVREEQRQYAIKRNNKKDSFSEDENDILHASISILFSAHEFLGPKGWCLTNDGELLHFILDNVLDRLDTPIFEKLRDKIDIHIEQALFCLYQHPSKKNKVSRHLADHNVDPLPLTWERSFQLYEFYGPGYLPEFNSYKNASISADLEQLFKRIIALVPSHCNPQQHLTKIMDYIHGKTDCFPEGIDFPAKVRSIYYLIGDFHFKQREFSRCIKYFQLDLCINPLRLDSWACLGLSYAAQLDSKLNYCEKFKSDTEFLEKAKYATICFKKALEISPDPLMLWIECGTFQYTVHSYCSRVLKYESENFSMERFEYFENEKNNYLDNSGNSFEKAIALYEMEDTNEPDERWLQYYILGKIAEKKQKEPAEYLHYYMTAITLLDENNAQYPEKINYNNPQHLSVEALELHYRINASILKYLELHEGKEIPNTLGDFFKKCLDSSKFFKKPIPKETTESVVKEVVIEPQAKTTETPAKTTETPAKTIETSAKTVEPTGSSGFQEQFLNSLSKLGSENTDLPMEDESDNNKSEENVEKVEKETLVEEKEPEKIEVDIDEEVKIIEPVSESVICISDSEEEKESKEKRDAKKMIEKECSEKQEEKQESTKKDVQQLLDEMMVETMKETEQQQNEVDSDLSGAEKIEEVVVKEDNEGKDKKDLENKFDKTESRAKGNKKSKPSDCETDTENKKAQAEDSNSSSSSSDSSSESSDSESDDDDDSSGSSSSSSSDDDNENMTANDILQLIETCVRGLEICIVRLTLNYKAIYRLAHLYFNYKAKKDLTKCKQLLLSEYTCKDGSNVSGLFSDRKANNFFNGIWRIPSTEIDRPGSLSAHMNRCITLLLQILSTTNDTKTLIDMCLNLRKAPEQDKIYIKDSDRLSFSEQALTMCTQCLRSQIKDVANMTNPQIAKLLQEIFNIYQRLQKHIPGKEGTYSVMLVEVYKQFIKEKIPDNVNILDLAVKFCIQNKSADKPKPPPVFSPTSSTLPRGPGIGSPPVLPAPATVAPPQNIPPMKRPGPGRPRGRPPLPKVPGQVRQPRAKAPNHSSASKSANWQKNLFDQTYAYEYLKHYQDELIKQYSQNLNLNQLTQLSQILAQGQIHNPLTASAITNQFLAQTGLMNPSSFFKQGTSNMASTAQLLDNLKQLNPSLKKKFGIDQMLAGLNAGIPTSVSSTAIPKNTIANTATSLSGIISTKTKTSSSQGKSSSITQVKSSSVSTVKPAPVISIMPTSAPAKTTSAASTIQSSHIFKEPVSGKMTSEDKAAKDYIKDRPNLSITPVTSGLPPPPVASPTFMKPPVTSSSGGKTLQEKLAEKKKEQLKKNMEAEAHNADAFIKSLNLPNIPSTLTLSKTIPTTSGNVPIIPPQISRSSPDLLIAHKTSSKYPMEISRPNNILSNPPYPETTRPNHNPISKPLVPTPTFPVESGISINQVPVGQSSKSKQTSNKEQFSLGSSIELSTLKTKYEKHVSKLKTDKPNFKSKSVKPVDISKEVSEPNFKSKSVKPVNIGKEVSEPNFKSKSLKPVNISKEVSETDFKSKSVKPVNISKEVSEPNFNSKSVKPVNIGKEVSEPNFKPKSVKPVNISKEVSEPNFKSKSLKPANVSKVVSEQPKKSSVSSTTKTILSQHSDINLIKPQSSKKFDVTQAPSVSITAVKRDRVDNEKTDRTKSTKIFTLNIDDDDDVICID